MGTDSPLHQDASIWPKKTNLTETGSKMGNLVLSVQFIINSQADQCEGVLDTVKYTDKHPNRTERLSPLAVLL